MTISETMQEEEIKITLSPWLLTASPCLMAQMVKNPQVWSLGQEDPLEKGMATYSSILKATFLFPPNSVSVLFIWLRWTEKAKNLVSKRVITIGAVIAVPFSKLPYAEMGRKRIQQNWLLFFFFSSFACQMWKWLTSNDKQSTWPDYGWRVRGYPEKKAWNCCTSWEFLLWQVKLYVLLCLFLQYRNI